MRMCESIQDRLISRMCPSDVWDWAFGEHVSHISFEQFADSALGLGQGVLCV